jgi:hypothetical protein
MESYALILSRRKMIFYSLGIFVSGCSRSNNPPTTSDDSPLRGPSTEYVQSLKNRDEVVCVTGFRLVPEWLSGEVHFGLTWGERGSFQPREFESHVIIYRRDRNFPAQPKWEIWLDVTEPKKNIVKNLSGDSQWFVAALFRDDLNWGSYIPRRMKGINGIYDLYYAASVVEKSGTIVKPFETDVRVQISFPPQPGENQGGRES